MKQEIENAGHPYLFRYRPDNDYTLDEIENSYIYFSDRNSLNDPFDSSPDLINFISDKINPKDYLEFYKKRLPSEIDENFLEKNYTPEELTKITLKNIPKYLDAFGIACFSMMPYINMTLWANYANNHQGICIQYQSDYDKRFFENLQVVNYYEKLEKIDFNPIEDEFKIQDVFYMKDQNWNYEKELRLVKFNKGKLAIKNDAIRNIVCGYRADEAYIQKLIEVSKIHPSHIKIYKMEKPRKQYEVSLTKIN